MVNNLVPVADLECVKGRLSDQNIFPEGSLKTDEEDLIQRIHCEAISSTPPENKSDLYVFSKETKLFSLLKFFLILFNSFIEISLTYTIVCL